MLAALALVIIAPPRFVTAETRSGEVSITVHELVGTRTKLLAQTTLPWHHGGEGLGISNGGGSLLVLPRGPDLATLRLNAAGSKLAFIHSGPATHRRFEPGQPTRDWPKSGPRRVVITDALTLKPIQESNTAATDIAWTSQGAAEKLQYLIPNDKNPSLFNRSFDPIKYSPGSRGQRKSPPANELLDSSAKGILSKAGITLCNGREKICTHRKTGTLLESGFLRVSARQIAAYGFDKSGEHKVWLLSQNSKRALQTKGKSVKKIQSFGDRIVVTSYLSISRNGIMEIFDPKGRKITELSGQYFSPAHTGSNP